MHLPGLIFRPKRPADTFCQRRHRSLAALYESFLWRVTTLNGWSFERSMMTWVKCCDPTWSLQGLGYIFNHSCRR